MRYFIGIRPPSTLSELVTRFRRQHGWQGMEPHITVKAPCGLGEPASWLPTVRQLCQTIEAFPVEFGGIGTFGSSVLFLQVTSPALLVLHHRLLRELCTSLSDLEMCFEGPRYTPHLTLMHQQVPDATLNSVAIDAASGHFSEKLAFQANELVVYEKDAMGTYQAVEAISFRSNSLASELLVPA